MSAKTILSPNDQWRVVRVQTDLPGNLALRTGNGTPLRITWVDKPDNLGVWDLTFAMTDEPGMDVDLPYGSCQFCSRKDQHLHRFTPRG